MTRRLVQLYLGLILYGFSVSLLVVSGLGLNPWDVFHQGLAKHSSLAIGTWSILVGLVVLLLWIPLRQRPGIGTVSNVVFIGGRWTSCCRSCPSRIRWCCGSPASRRASC